MEGTHPDAPPALAPRPLPRSVKKWLVLVLAVVVIVAITALTISSLPGPPPIPLTVSDRSTTGLIEGNLTDISSLNPALLNVTATTYANQTGQPSSTLVLRVETYYFYEGTSPGGRLKVNLAVDALGHFASNLHPNGLQLTANATGGSGDSLYFWGSQKGVNVTFDPNQYFGVFPGSSGGAGPGQAYATPVNEGGGTYFDFVYSAAGMEAFEYLSHNESIGFRVTVSGPFTPSISAGVLLEIVDVAT